MATKERTDHLGDMVLGEYMRSLDTIDGESVVQGASPYFNRQTDDVSDFDVKNRIFNSLKADGKLQPYLDEFAKRPGAKIDGTDYGSPFSQMEFKEGADSGAWTFVASAVLGPIMGAQGFGALETALAKVGLSVATGGNPITSLANGGLSFLTGSFTGGAEGSGYAPTVDDLPVDTGGGGLIGTGDQYTFAGGVSDTGFGAGRVPTTGADDLNDALNASDLESGKSVLDGRGQTYDQFKSAMAPSVPTSPGASNSNESNRENNFDNGETQRILDRGPGGVEKSWYEKLADNKLAAAGIVGGLGLIGGIGSGLMAKSASDARIAADRELAERKTESEKDLLSYKRGLIQSGSYFDSRGTPTAAPKALLRRPDGSLVFNGGLIAQGARP